MTAATDTLRSTSLHAGRAEAVVTWAYACGFGIPAIPVGVYLLRRGSLPAFLGLFDMYGGPWSNRLDDGALRRRAGGLRRRDGGVSVGCVAGVARLSTWRTGRRRAAAGRGCVLDRLRAADPLARRGGPGGVAGCGMATAAMTFELFTPRRFFHA